MTDAEKREQARPKDKYFQAACDLKWAIRAIASARDAFLTQAYIGRLVDLENEVIVLRNEILQIK